jgi:hypothetical protein
MQRDTRDRCPSEVFEAIRDKLVALAFHVENLSKDKGKEELKDIAGEI